MIIKSAELETVVGVTTGKIPDTGQPEIAFAGRSNVGKSSLINALMNRRKLARVSETPGKTQTINFYHINNEFYLTDLPGYGYAKVNKDFKASWGKMIEDYLNGSRGLKAVFLLLDIRRDPNADDLLMFDWMVDAGFDPFIICTKWDKVKKNEGKRRLSEIEKALTGHLPEGRGLKMIPFSAQDKSGRDEIYELMEEILQESEAEN